MKKIIIFFSCFHFCLFVIADENFEAFNIWAGEFNGSTEGVAASILMGKQLKEEGPNRIVRIIYDPDDLLQIQRWFREVDGKKTQLIDDLVFIPIGREEVPKAGIALKFGANPRDHLAPEFLKSSETFLEFSDHDSFLPAFQWKGEHLSGKRVLFVPTGPQAAGMYVSKAEHPVSQLSREELLNRLKKFGYSIPDFKRPEEIKIALSHTKNKGIANAYNRVISEQLSPGDKVLVFVTGDQQIFKDIKISRKNYEKRLNFIDAHNIPLDLLEDLVSQADFPIAVSGDVVTSLALQYNKVFFYDGVKPWDSQFSFMPGLRDILSHPHYTGESKLIQTSINRSLIVLQEDDIFESVKKMARRMETFSGDQKSIKALKKSMKTLRPELSLTAYLDELLQILKLHDKKGGFDLALAVQYLMETRSHQSAIDLAMQGGETPTLLKLKQGLCRRPKI